MNRKISKEKTSFGFRNIDEKKKTKKVKEVFDTVSSNYDLMNDLLSFGVHRLWKRVAVNKCNLRPHHKILDLAGGTGDMVKLMSPKINEKGMLVLSDINQKMLHFGRDKLIDEGLTNVLTIQLDAQNLPFKENSFDVISIAFGLRNIANKKKSLRSALYCLKPGGLISILEFSRPTNENIREIYDLYSYEVIPKLGEIVAKSDESYRYLAESIRMHPNQGELIDLMKESGYTYCEYENLSNGIVSIHQGIKPK